MSLQDRTFDKISKYLDSELGDLGFINYKGDQYDEYTSPKVRLTLLSDTDGITISMVSDTDDHHMSDDVMIHTEGLGEFDPVVSGLPEFSEFMSVTMTLLGRGSEVLKANFEPSETQILTYLVKKAATINSK